MFRFSVRSFENIAPYVGDTRSRRNDSDCINYSCLPSLSDVTVTVTSLTTPARAAVVVAAACYWFELLL